jgi:hypothetical protein
MRIVLVLLLAACSADGSPALDLGDDARRLGEGNPDAATNSADGGLDDLANRTDSAMATDLSQPVPDMLTGDFAGCGTVQRECCPGAVCYGSDMAPMVCAPRTGQDNWCDFCGEVNQPCCAGNKCSPAWTCRPTVGGFMCTP